MHSFEPYTWQHILPVAFFMATGLLAIRWQRRLSDTSRARMGVLMAMAVLGMMVGGTAIKLVSGNYDIRNDLPLYLCRVIAWMLPLVIWKRNAFWIGICYFWILAGTFQGIVTPDLAEGFPSYFYFRYWFLHAGLVVVILYAVLAFRIQITWRDLWRATIATQVYLVAVHVINLLLDSNYSYTRQKPPGTSVLDIFGDWPWYILGAEALMMVLFCLLLLPWMLQKRGRRSLRL